MPDGLSGLEAFRADRPDIALLDVMVPGLDGVSLCRRIRDESTVPVIMLSASNLEEDRRAAARLGISAYLVKPIDWLGFSKVICESLRLHLC
jgi:DNA-binding response OmpR family regulator